MTGLVALVESIAAYERETWPLYVDLRADGAITHPIPFFGDISTALVLTVGVNPSATEFVNRDWPGHLRAEELAARLLSYFAAGAPVPPHPWFAKWTEPLSALGVAHGQGAAHIDLSPRATRSMSVCPVDRFLTMMHRDVSSFFATLAVCREARLLVLAGTVTKRHYLHRYLARAAPEYGYAVSIDEETRGPAPVAMGTLRGRRCSLPFFFCGVSPSARGASALGRRLRERSSHLIPIVSSASRSAGQA